jgi:hypothetical protein
MNAPILHLNLIKLLSCQWSFYLLHFWLHKLFFSQHNCLHFKERNYLNLVICLVNSPGLTAKRIPAERPSIAIHWPDLFWNKSCPKTFEGKTKLEMFKFRVCPQFRWPYFHQASNAAFGYLNGPFSVKQIVFHFLYEMVLPAQNISFIS